MTKNNTLVSPEVQKVLLNQLLLTYIKISKAGAALNIAAKEHKRFENDHDILPTENKGYDLAHGLDSRKLHLRKLTIALLASHEGIDNKKLTEHINDIGFVKFAEQKLEKGISISNNPAIPDIGRWAKIMNILDEIKPLFEYPNNKDIPSDVIKSNKLVAKKVASNYLFPEEERKSALSTITNLENMIETNIDLNDKQAGNIIQRWVKSSFGGRVK